MKKILMVLFVMLFFSITNVEAQNYKLFLDKQEGIYYARSGDLFLINQVNFLYIDLVII